ncbi:hypothetical protein S1OALGB6SA_170 [Olavius algarvensis spirochete endosymbiont]|nr:hypothetical protein S1OALGB6SA_170 [Olavius algarvensis spirochete endosymbiont]
MRGLKQKIAENIASGIDVAPLAGAWIETRIKSSISSVR